MATLLQSSVPPERILDLVVAWDDVSGSSYDPVQSKFLAKSSAKLASSAPQQGALHELSAFHQKLQDLKS